MSIKNKIKKKLAFVEAVGQWSNRTNLNKENLLKAFFSCEIRKMAYIY